MKTLILATLSLVIISCGPVENNRTDTPRSSFQYSYCGQITGSANQLQINSQGQVYNLSTADQNILASLSQTANTNQNTCVYTNVQPQNTSTNGNNSVYVGYSLPTIVVQSINNGGVTNNGGSYPVQLCGLIYRGNSFNGGIIYYVQVNGATQTSAVTSYIIQPNNNMVTNMLTQVQSQRNGCVMASSQPQASNSGPIVYAEQVVWQ